jgi:hypothetical protein
MHITTGASLNKPAVKKRHLLLANVKGAHKRVSVSLTLKVSCWLARLLRSCTGRSPRTLAHPPFCTNIGLCLDVGEAVGIPLRQRMNGWDDWDAAEPGVHNQSAEALVVPCAFVGSRSQKGTRWQTSLLRQSLLLSVALCSACSAKHSTACMRHVEASHGDPMHTPMLVGLFERLVLLLLETLVKPT